MVAAGLHSVQQESETGWRHISQAGGYQHPAAHGRTELILAFFVVSFVRDYKLIPNLPGLEVRAGLCLWFMTLRGLWTDK